MASSIDKTVMVGVSTLIAIITIFLIYVSLVPVAMDTGDSMSHDATCVDLSSSAGACPQWDAGTDYDTLDCEQNYDGSMVTSGNWTPWVKTVDMNWSSYGECNMTEQCYTIFTYYAPDHFYSDAAKWEVSDNGTRVNLTLNYNYLITENATHKYLRLRVLSFNGTETNWSQWNGSTYLILRNAKAGSLGKVYDQYLWWLDSSPRACSVNIAGVCQDNGWFKAPNTACPTAPSNIPLGDLFAGGGIIFLILMVALLFWVISITIKKQK